jgi:hypothetical protein
LSDNSLSAASGLAAIGEDAIAMEEMKTTIGSIRQRIYGSSRRRSS